MQSQFYSYQPVPIPQPQAHPQPQPMPQQLVPMQAPNYTINNTHYTPQQYLYIAPNNTNNGQMFNVNDELNQEQSPTTNPFIDHSNTNNKEIKTERSNDRPSLTKYINSGQRTAAVDLTNK